VIFNYNLPESQNEAIHTSSYVAHFAGFGAYFGRKSSYAAAIEVPYEQFHPESPWTHFYLHYFPHLPSCKTSKPMVINNLEVMNCFKCTSFPMTVVPIPLHLTNPPMISMQMQDSYVHLVICHVMLHMCPCRNPNWEGGMQLVSKTWDCSSPFC